MKTLGLLVALSLAATTLAFLPEAEAVGTCTSATNRVNTGPDCPYFFCYGTSWSYGDRYYTCHKYIDFPPPCYCTIETGVLP